LSSSSARTDPGAAADLNALVRDLDARQGLPLDLFLLVSRLTPMVNVDLLIQDDAGRTLLTWRDDESFGTGWHLPGGVIRFKERAAERILACAHEELGVGVVHDAEPAAVVESVRKPDVRGHLVSLLYRCRVTSELDESRHATDDPPAAGHWRWHLGCPPDLVEVQAPYTRYFSQP